VENGLDGDGDAFEVGGSLWRRRQPEGVQTDAIGRDGAAGGGVQAKGVEGLGVDPGFGGFEGDETQPAITGGAKQAATDHGLTHTVSCAGDEDAGCGETVATS